MKIDIIESPVSFNLHGKSSAVQDNRIPEVGMSLMNEMWKIVKQAGAATTGINHWVYLQHGRMFVGIEMLPNSQVPAGLEPLQFTLQRYLKHLHIGPYQNLPEKWQALKDELAACGETMGSPCLEVYGHHCDDPAKQETTILISLQPERA